ncbi:tape measure protein [Pseudomonas fluorescens]|uniref:Uncharacterized protein n=1 Tax=Pseudomonas fluorescens TaxID=294 RepID=A0A5E6RF82_PSEFL|nr:tape measure protein [Pseudomonas fluorescens]VVM66731.1 hypothetical protein PS652_01563 [Pseudomonas fluorescens]
MASRSLGTLTLDLIARIGGFQEGMNRASRSVASTGAAADAAASRINALQGQFLSLSAVASRIAGPLAAAFSVTAVHSATEAYSTLTNRLKLVTDNSTELAAAQKAVFGIAQDSAQPLAATAELYQRIATNQDALKLSGEGVAGIVGTISKTLAISGSSAESANAALIQLGQAFASGVLRGEELNSVMEQAPALSQAIAAGMGKTVGELRAMGAAGELTAQAVVKALQSQSGAVDALFAKTATTIGNSFTKISNSLTHFIGELDQATGASSRVSAEFVGLSKAIDNSLPAVMSSITKESNTLSQVLTTGLFVALGRVAGGYAQQAGAALYSASASKAALAAAADTAKKDLWAAQAKQIDAKALMERAALEIKAAEGKVASDRARQISELANLKATQSALVAERQLEQQRLAAQITDVGRTKSLTRLAELRQAEVAMLKSVEKAERALAATTTAASAQIRQAYAMRTAAVTAYGETTAVANALAATSRAADSAAASATVAGRAFGALANAGRGLLALMGGPVGLLFISGAVALSFVDFRSSSDKAKEGLEQLRGPMDDVIARFKAMTEEQRAGALVRWGEAQAEAVKAAKEELDSLQATLKKGVLGSDSLSLPSRIAGSSNAQTIQRAKDYKDLSDQLQEVAKNGGSMIPVLEKAGKIPGVSPTLLNDLKKSAEGWSNQDQAAKEATARLAQLSAAQEKSSVATSAAATATSSLTAAGQKYLQTIQQKLVKLQDNNDAVKEANRFISEHKDLSEADRIAILSAAHASKAQDEANKAATKSTREHASEMKSLKKTFADAEENYQRQIELMNTSTDKRKNATEVEKLAFEVASGKYENLNSLQKKSLEGYAAELDAKKTLLKADQDAKRLAALDFNLKEENRTAKDGFDQELAGAGRGEKYRERFREMLSIEQDFNKQRREMYKEYKEAEIAGDPDAEANYKKETALLSDALATRLSLQVDYYSRLDEAQSNWMDGVSDAWQNFVDYAQDYSVQAADATASVLGSARSELSSFMSDVATGSKDAGDALMDMVTGFAKATVGALTDMAAQWLVYQAVQLMVGKATQSSAGLALVAHAQAASFQAQLAAYASTAAIPMIGPAAAPAAAATAAMATAPMVAGVASTALMGMAHSGIDSIPREGTWLLDGGERVLNPNQNRDLTQYLRNAGDAGRGMNTGLPPIKVDVVVQVPPGTSADDSKRIGDSVGAALDQKIEDALYRATQQGGILWRRT